MSTTLPGSLSKDWRVPAALDSRLPGAAELICGATIALVLLHPFSAPTDAIVITALLVISCVAFFAASVAVARRARGAARPAFIGLAAASVFAFLAQVLLAVPVLVPGTASPLPGLALWLVLLGAHPSLMLGFAAALRWRRPASAVTGAARFEVTIDALLLAVTAIIIGIQLSYVSPWPAGAASPAERTVMLLWRALMSAELILVTLLIAFRGEVLGLRTAFGLALGTFIFSVGMALRVHITALDVLTAGRSLELVWVCSLFAYSVGLRHAALRQAAGTDDAALTAPGSPTLRAQFAIAAILLSSVSVLVVGFRAERSPALAVALALFGLLLAVRTGRALALQHRQAQALARSVEAERALSTTLEQRVSERTSELAHAERRFRTLFRAAPDAVLTVVEDGRVREANDAVRELTGMSSAEVMGRPLADLVIPAEREQLASALASAFAGVPARLEVRVERAASADLRPGVQVVALAARRIPDADPPVVLLVGRNITGEREMRARLLETERLAAIGELVAGVAHEVNNPLSSVSGFAQILLLEDGLTPDQRESLSVIHSEAMRASQVVKDLLAFARRRELESEPVDMNEIVARTIRMRAYELSSYDVRVEQVLAAGLPNVIGDGRQLQQVLLNLVTNAIQAMASSKGGVLRIATRHEGDQVVLEVSDTGSGIAPEVLSRVFEPFFTTKEVGEGTGLGLSVSYGIIAAHGGTLRVGETSPRGTTFVATLPPAPPGVSAAASASRASSLSPAGARTITPPSMLTKLRLLVVDDEPLLRRSIEGYALLRGHSVVSAADGRTALELARRSTFDAVICDLRMPGMDGYAFHDALRMEHPWLASRTVFVTGDLMGVSGRSSQRTTDRITLKKPFTFEQLDAALRAATRTTATGDGSAPTHAASPAAAPEGGSTA